MITCALGLQLWLGLINGQFAACCIAPFFPTGEPPPTRSAFITTYGTCSVRLEHPRRHHHCKPRGECVVSRLIWSAGPRIAVLVLNDGVAQIGLGDCATTMQGPSSPDPLADIPPPTVLGGACGSFSFVLGRQP